MSPSNEQVVALYESADGEITPEEIYEAMDRQVDIRAIKMTLMDGSRLYREKQKKDKDLFTDQDLEDSIKVTKQLMFSAESDLIKLRAALRIQDHKLGRLDFKNARSINISMTNINQEFKASEEAIKKAKGKVIEIDPRHKHLMSVEN